MIIKPLLVLKPYAFLIAVCYSIAVVVVSLIQFKDLPSNAPVYSDKLVHFLMYTVFTLLWVRALVSSFKFSIIKAIIYASVISVAFGIIIEVLQEQFTLTRVFDFYDISANILGALLAVVILLIKNKIDVKKE